MRTRVWFALAAGLVALDYFLGPGIQIPSLFVIPVALAAWWSGRWAGVGVAVALPLARLYFRTALDSHGPPIEAIVNAGLRISVLVLVAVVADGARWTLALTREVRILRGLVPVCGLCRRVRDQSDAWHPMEKYIAEGAPGFKPLVCPECHDRHYSRSLDRT